MLHELLETDDVQGRGGLPPPPVIDPGTTTTPDGSTLDDRGAALAMRPVLGELLEGSDRLSS